MTRPPRAGRRSALLLAAAAAAAAALPVRAAPPAPLSSPYFSFPGAVPGPGSAASAGLALADRWLADEPFANPAVAPGRGAAVSGLLLHMSRQDLRAGNRNFDETPVFLDGAGLAVGLPAPGRLALALYAYQPVLRREENAFSSGTGTPNPASPPPAAIETRASSREVRAGLAASAPVGPARVGLGAEWTRREDLYRLVERSGAPEAGSRRLVFSGDAVGFLAGARLDRGDSLAGGLSVGAALRYLAPLAVAGPHSESLLVAVTHETVRAERASGWEMGVTARWALSLAFRLFGALGGRTAQRWEGFHLEAGRAWEWKLAAELHDARDPWTLRVGLGQERQAGAPEPRADVLGLGIGWRFAPAEVELGLLHRTLVHEPAPRSFDDRVVLTVRTAR